MNCDNPECYNVIQPGRGTRVLTRFCWDDLKIKTVIVCSQDCIDPALAAKP